MVQLQSQAYHANNKDKHSQTGEPACAGHPITADRMPRTEGSSRLLWLSLSTSAHSAFSRLLPTTARRYGLGPPVRFAFLRENHLKASTHHHAAALASLYTPALRGSLAPLANLATVRLPHGANPQALPRAYPAQYDRGDGVSSKRNLIHTVKCSLSFVPCVPNGLAAAAAAAATLLPPERTYSLHLPCTCTIFPFHRSRFH